MTKKISLISLALIAIVMFSVGCKTKAGDKPAGSAETASISSEMNDVAGTNSADSTTAQTTSKTSSKTLTVSKDPGITGDGNADFSDLLGATSSSGKGTASTSGSTAVTSASSSAVSSATNKPVASQPVNSSASSSMDSGKDSEQGFSQLKPLS